MHAHFFLDFFFWLALLSFLEGFLCPASVVTTGGSSASSCASVVCWILNLSQIFLTTDFSTGGATTAHARQILSKHVFDLKPLLRRLSMSLLLTLEQGKGILQPFPFRCRAVVEEWGCPFS
jgi:hypothetical protein